MKLPISITSIIDGPYPESIDEGKGILNYRYRGTNARYPGSNPFRLVKKLAFAKALAGKAGDRKHLLNRKIF